MILELNVMVGPSADHGWQYTVSSTGPVPNHRYRGRPLQDVTGDNRRLTERRKKTVRFGGPEEEEYTWTNVRWDSDRQGSQDSQTKDSGIDTSSTFTSSEDSNRGDILPKVFKI